MVRPCDTCLNYRKEIDEFRKQYVDVVVIGETRPEPHFCPMYNSNIPNEIYYDGAQCDFYIGKEDEPDEMQA